MAVIQTNIKARSFLQRAEIDASFEAMLSSCSKDELDAFAAFLDLPPDDMESVIAALSAEEYKNECPVPIEQFLDDDDYLGKSCTTLYKPWRRDLIELFSSCQYQVAIILGGLGSGKSEFSAIALIRMLYEASCYRDPAVSYGLSSGSKISFCLAAPSEQVARASAFDKIVSKIRQSAYFMEKFAPITSLRDNKVFRGNELLFPKNLSIVCGSSSQMASLGANVMGGFIDELNFFQPNAKNYVRTNERYGDFEKAGRLFDSLKRRIVSRFMKQGKLPGVLIAASSKTTKDSLSERFIREAIQTNDPTVFVRDYSIVDVKREMFSEKTFKVLVGNEYYSSKILPEHYDLSEIPNSRQAVIVDVPEDLRGEFERDVNGALRDLMGVSTSAIHSFITKVEFIQQIKNSKRSHPFLSPLCPNPTEWDSRSPYIIRWEKLANCKENGEWEPLEEPWAKRFIHLDPASTGDAMGLCMAHIAGLIPVRTQTEKEEIVEYLPYYKVDFILRIKGSRSEEILYRKIRELIYDISLHGFHISRITTDTYQSREMIQILQGQGFRAEIISVDESKDPYLTLRRAIYDRRIECYDYPILWEELRKLEETPMKIDHVANGSKDCSDALCGVVYSLSEEVTHSEPILPEKGISVVDTPDTFSYVTDRNENFQQVDIIGSTAAVSPTYRKKTDVAPAYQKITDDGQIINLSKAASKEKPSQYLHADFIEVG